MPRPALADPAPTLQVQHTDLQPELQWFAGGPFYIFDSITYSACPNRELSRAKLPMVNSRPPHELACDSVSASLHSGRVAVANVPPFPQLARPAATFRKSCGMGRRASRVNVNDDVFKAIVNYVIVADFVS